MKQEAIKVDPKPGLSRVYAGGAAIVACVVVLGWVYWPRGAESSAAPAEIEQRAERIAEEIRQKEPASTAERAAAAPAPAPGSGPENVRSKGRGK